MMPIPCSSAWRITPVLLCQSLTCWYIRLYRSVLQIPGRFYLPYPTASDLTQLAYPKRMSSPETAAQIHLIRPPKQLYMQRRHTRKEDASQLEDRRRICDLRGMSSNPMSVPSDRQLVQLG
jgi:hypothetical protein